MSNEQQAAQMQQMAEQMMHMAGAGAGKKDKSRVSKIVGNEIRTWGDARRAGRFNQPHERENIFERRTGQDPLKKILHNSREKKEPLNIEDIQHALFQPGVYDPNFQPLHEVLVHPYWSDSEKMVVLKKCLEFGPDVNQRGSDKETPFHDAIRLKDPTIAKSAVMALVEHGVDLSSLDKSGAKPLHYVFEYGYPELIPALMARQASCGNTGKGLSASHLALSRFEKSMALNLSNDPVLFEKALNTYYKSMAYIKVYKLHNAEFSMDEHHNTLLRICKDQPGYRKHIDNLERNIEKIQPLAEFPKVRPARPYSNEGYGFNYEIEEAGGHPWLGGFTSFMDKLSEKVAKSNYIQRSKNRVEELFNKPHLVTNSKVLEHLKKERMDFDIDYVVGGAGVNPEGDTILTKIARSGQISGIFELVEMNANLNAQDIHGNTAMHLLVANCNDKETLLLGLKQLCGTPNSEGQILTFGGVDNYADRNIVNAQGDSFMDMLQARHPEWVQEFVQELRAQPMRYSLPDLEISKTLLLEGPEGLLRLEKNPDPYLLMDETIPTVSELDSVASEQERSEHVQEIAKALVKIQALKDTASPEKIQTLNKTAEQILQNQTPETKMQASIMFAQEDNMDSYKINAQSMLLQNLGHTMRSGTDVERRRVFDTFEKADVDLQFRITALLRAQSVTLAGQSSTLGEDDQGKFDTAVQGLQAAAAAFENHMAAQARTKYGIENISNANQQKQKPESP